MKEEFRRFEIINKKNYLQLKKLLSDKGITREELLLILQTVKLRNL